MSEEDQAWLDYRKRFAEMYDKSNYESPLQAFVMRAGHREAERRHGRETHFSRVLEIGAGTGEHFPHVKHSFDSYLVTDADPRALAVAQKRLAKPDKGMLEFSLQTGEHLNFPDGSFDRLIAAHVLEHICQPHLVIKEWRRVIRKGGELTILIPTDPGFAWRTARHLGPRRRAIRQGIEYDYIMAREHINPCHNLVALLKHYFPLGTGLWWPLRLPSIDMNLFFVFHATIDSIEK